MSRSIRGMKYIVLGIAVSMIVGCAAQQQATGMRTKQGKEDGDRLAAECKAVYATSALDPIRAKVFTTGPATFDQLANVQYPTLEEKVAIREWANLSIPCGQKWKNHWKTYATPMHVNLFVALSESADGLRVQLHNGQITYGQYIRERQKLGRDFDTAWTNLNAELARQNVEAQNRAEQIAQQYYQNSLIFQQNLQQQQKLYQTQQQQQHGMVTCDRIGTFTYCNY